LKSRSIFVVVVIFVVCVGAAYFWWPSEERAVRNRLRALAEALSVPAQDTDITRVTRLAQLRRYFADDVEIRRGTSDPQSISRDAVLGAVASWQPAPGGVTIEFVDVQVTLGSDKTSATVYLTAKISAHEARGGEGTGEPSGEPKTSIDAREAHVGMVKRNGEWVVASVESDETLQRPPS
jgi:hypothetical protein